MKVFSFDIFDTCLVRKCGESHNLFDILAYLVLGENSSDIQRMEFVDIRIKGEQKARITSQKEDITIYEIYGQCVFEGLTSLPVEEILILEVKLEKEFLLPVISIKSLIKSLRKQDHKIVFISDMYLPSCDIVEVLKRYDIFQDGDDIYISGDIGLSKSSGNLFKYIQEENGYSYKNWKHCGDNKYSDIKVPESLGIQVQFVNHNFTPYEEIWKNSYDTKYQYSKLLAGVSRAIRLSSDEDLQVDFTVDLISPLYVPLVYKILLNAQNDNIDTLFFLSRDAYILFIIAQSLQSLFPFMSLKYIYISRDSLYNNHTNEDLRLEYFIQTGLATVERKSGIVDVRTTGKTQKTLNDLLENNGYNKVRGYYFEVVSEGRDFIFNEDCYFEFYNNKKYINPLLNGLADHSDLLEHFFSLTDKPRTIGYKKIDNEICPVFENVDIDDIKMKNLSIIANVHCDAVLKFTKIFIQTKLYKYADNILYSLAIPTICSFGNKPQKHYLRALVDFAVYDEHRCQYVPYIIKFKLKDWLYFFFCREKIYNQSRWKNGSLYLNVSDFTIDFYHRIKILNK